MPSSHKLSYSNHKLFKDVLRWTQRYVTLARVFGLLLLLGASDVFFRDGNGLANSDAEGSAEMLSMVKTSSRRAAAIGLATAGLMGLLVALLVRAPCSLSLYIKFYQYQGKLWYLITLLNGKYNV